MLILLAAPLSGIRPPAPVVPVRVEAPGIFNLPILQQPASDPTFVSSRPGSVTQFSLSAQFDNIGLMAHNDRAGALFYKLETGQHVWVTESNGWSRLYRVTHFYRFQALEPHSPYSDFIDLETDEFLTSTDVFYRVYAHPNRVVFQTCIEGPGSMSWGRLFVVAMRNAFTPTLRPIVAR